MASPLRFATPTALVAAFTALVSPNPAMAFCGAYVGDPSDSMSNTSSEVILARDGNTTTLTLIMDYEGTANEFAVLLPVPQVLNADDVGSVNQDLVEWIGDFSVPRQVAYSCDDIFETKVVKTNGCALGFGCSSYAPADGSLTDKASDDYDTGVTVESSFTEQGYEFVVLSADESTGLFTWLTNNGYAVPEGGEAMLQEYLDAGVYFLAAKVALSSVEVVDGWLPPIQLRYESDFFGLPIRIGTISASGPQDVIIYALTDLDKGEVLIANYPELPLPTECTWSGEDFGDWYEEQLDEAWAENGAGWVKEYSWELEPTEAAQGYHCDPCTATPAAPTADGSFGAFGLQSRSAHLTRLHVRYAPEEATMDLVLNESGITGINEQLKYIDPKPELEALFPDCDEGFAENPGQCPADPVAEKSASALGMLAVAAALAGAVSFRRRSRE